MQLNRAAAATSYRRRVSGGNVAMLPFTREQFLAVFAEYNRGVWPAQVIAYAIGFVIVALIGRRSARHDRWIAAALALMWGWTGVAYHVLYFVRINKLALVFGALFAAEA